MSAINTAYQTLGLDPPGKALNAERLYFDVKKALEGFKKLRSGASPSAPLRGQPTPATALIQIYALSKMSSNALDTANLSVAHGGLANVFQYYMISRPTMTAMMRWEDINFCRQHRLK